MAPSKIPWLTQPDLFLLSQGGVVQVWKCKRSISEAVLMKRSDFVYVDDVLDHLDLIENMFKWVEADYKRLIKYISERRLLVNGQGLVIAELPKFGLDGKIDESVSPLFMWSLDILALDTYMEHYKVRPIPFRQIQYLEDKMGPSSSRDVPVELSPNELKLSADLDKEDNDKNALEKEVGDLVKTNKEVEDEVAKLNVELTAKTNEADAAQRELDGMKSQLGGRVADLEAKNRVLEELITQLTVKLGDLRRQIASLQEQINEAKNDKDALDRKVADLQNQLDILINNINKKKPEVDPSWMTDNWESDWVDFYGLKKGAFYEGNTEDGDPLELSQSRTNFGEDNTTNVGRNLFYGVKYSTMDDSYFNQKVADIGRLGPAGYAKARFNPSIWYLLDNAGTLYASRGTGRPVTEFN